MGFCAEKGVGLSFLSQSGKFLARISGPVRGNVLLRKRQFLFSNNEDDCVAIAKTVLLEK